MPTHYWGDNTFDWNSLYKAEQEIRKIVKLARIGVHSKEKYGCYDEQTEVLTNNGWKYFKDVDIQKDLFISIDSEDNIFYQKASKYFEYNYSGKMYSLNTRGVNLLVTDNHKLYLAKAPTNGGINNCGKRTFPYELTTYEKYFRLPKIFKKGGNWEGSEIQYIKVSDSLIFEADPFLALLGWYVAEGCTSKLNQITFCLNYKNKKEINLVENILLSLNLKPKVDYKRGVINIYNQELAAYFNFECGKLALNKKVPNFIKNLSSRQITIFLNNLYLGDGHKARTSHILTTISQILANDVAELTLKSNSSFKISYRDRQDSITYIKNRPVIPKHRAYEINWLKNSQTHITPNSHDTFEKIADQEKIVDYTGKVYCVEVPNHILFVKRGGKGVFCGNSIRWSLYLFNGSLHSFTHPGHMYSRYPKWLWKFNVYNRFPIFIVKFLQFFQVEVVKFAFHKVCAKYPHIAKEIVMDAPEQLLPIDLGMLNRSMWFTSCKHCEESVRCDMIVCEHCNGSLL